MRRKKQVDFFTTESVQEYDELAAYLELNGISVQRINEVRAFGVTDFVSDFGPAILRVSEEDLVRANQLFEQWLKQPEEKEGHEVFSMHEKLELDLHFFRTKRKILLGSRLEKVYYLKANDFEYDCGHLHSIDLAVVLVFDNGKTLSWIFTEITIEEHYNEGLPFYRHGYQLKFEDVRGQIAEDFSVIELTENAYWQKLMRKPIKDVQVCSQNFGNERIVTDLFLATSTQIVLICSTRQPTNENGKTEFDLSIDKDWTTIVFDPEIIKLSERISI